MKLFITSIFVLTTSLLAAQSFEGTLVYKTDVAVHLSEKMAKMGLTEKMLLEKMKEDGSWTDSTRTSYKQGNYIGYAYTNPLSWSIYKSEDNKLYSFQEGEASDVCTVTDVSVDLEFKLTGKKPVIAKLDTVADVNGKKCEVVRVKWKTGTYDYYYVPGFLKADAKLFEKHVYDGWSEFLKISNAFPVKIVKSTKGLATVTFTLVRSKEEKIDSRLFEIPTLVADEELNAIKIPNQEMMRIKK